MKNRAEKMSFLVLPLHPIQSLISSSGARGWMWWMYICRYAKQSKQPLTLMTKDTAVPGRNRYHGSRAPVSPLRYPAVDFGSPRK